jgi:PKD repeat protein
MKFKKTIKILIMKKMFKTINQKPWKLFLFGSMMLLFSFTVKSQCNANFTNATIGNGTVSFTSTSTGSYPFSSYVWNFGDGYSGYGFTTTHSYLANNTYNAILYYTNYDSISGLFCKDSVVKPIIVSNVAPCNFNATLGYTIGASGLASFTCTSLQSPNISVSWNFGDGNFGTGSALNHVYISNGIFTVTALAHQLGTACYDTVSQMITITNSNGNPCANIANFSDTALSGGNVYFASTSVSVSPITSYVWNFGDGTLGSGASINHTYNFNSTYNVILYTTSFDSLLGITCSDSIVKQVVVTNANSNPCNTASIITYNYGANGLVNFTAFSPVMNPLLISYTWNFGDGNFGSGDSISHTYASNGTYGVYTVAHINGTTCYDTIFQNITVSNVGGLPCSINASFTSALGANGNVAFTNTTTGATFWSYSIWNFGDGTNTFNSGIGNVQHTYAFNGIYNIQLVVYDTILNCRDTVANAITVSNAIGGNCNANFIVSPDSSGGVWFISNSIGVAPNTSYVWSFGDGTAGFGQSINHLYNSNGQYTVTLIISTVDSFNNIFCFDSTSNQVIIGTACNANATFTMAPDSTAALTWMAMPVYAPTTVSAVWYWGDGTSTSGFNPSHTYLAPGIYNICVIVTDACGAMDTACITSNIMKSSNGSGLIYTVNVISNFTPLGIQNVINDNVKLNIYPNPSNGEFTISSKSETQFSVMNELGQIVKTEAINAANNFSVKVSGLNSGVYFIVANSQNTTYRKKIVVTK